MASPNVVPYAAVQPKKLSNRAKWVLFTVFMLLNFVPYYLPVVIDWLFPWFFLDHYQPYNELFLFISYPYDALIKRYLIYQHGRFETWMYSAYYANLAFYFLYSLIAGGALWYRILRWLFAACIIFHFLLVVIAYTTHN
jgi:hypothetical protein